MLLEVAAQLGQSPARVALAWVLARPGIASVLMGASRAGQVRDNVGALDLALPPAQMAALEAVSARPPSLLYSLFQPALRQQAVFGGAAVTPW